MDQYSELHTTSRMLVEAATDARQIGGMVTGQLQRLDKMLLTQERLNREIQETVLSARMVPIKTVVPRLQRSVRQTCRLTGKQVELQISGADTLMDSEVLERVGRSVDARLAQCSGSRHRVVGRALRRGQTGQRQYLAGFPAGGQQHPGALQGRRRGIRFRSDSPRS